MVDVIDQISRHAKRIANGKDPKVTPGAPARFTEASTVGDCIWQGDLGLVIATVVPGDYVKIAKAVDQDRQLVPGNTVGAKHCLDSLLGVELYRPKNWTEKSLEGPFFLLTEERTVMHPTHGNVTIPAGFGVQCHYQREWDRVLQQERRAAD